MKYKSMRFRIYKAVLKGLGDITISPRFPFIGYGSCVYKVRADEMRRVLSILEPGDILLGRHDKYVGGKFVPGFYSHAAIYVGENTVVHAIGDGVGTEDILCFLRRDWVAVIKTPDISRDCVVKTAKSKEGLDYDWLFDNKCPERFSCTELVEFCIENTQHKETKIEAHGLSKGCVRPDAFLDIGWEIKHESRFFRKSP